jgi:inositol phosphorylceramide mannosyltransferase catalytic subunit
MIERNIFQSWYTRDIPIPVYQNIDKFRKLNPNYNYYLFTDEDMDRFVNENYKGLVADCYNRLNIIVAKVDFWRYLVLYKCGGIYVDMDSSIEVPLDNFINECDNAIITTEGNPYFFVQWALIFKKEHPILKKCIDLIVQNITNNTYPNNIHKMTGPSVFTEAIQTIHKELFNDHIDINMVNEKTDTIYKHNDASYRLFGVDYNNKFIFKHSAAHLLYINKKTWTQEQTEKPLLKPQYYVFS